MTRAFLSALALGALLAGCSGVPRGAYFPSPSEPMTARIAQALHRAALAAGDEPERYSFAMVRTPVAAAASDEEATLYITDGLARLPMPVIEAVIAHEVAHEVLGHAGTRRALSLSLSAGFSVLGVLVPGASVLDFLANPVAVRAFTRRQELEADRKAVEILRAMGHAAPRRSLAEALRALDAASPRAKEEAQGLLANHPSLAERLLALEPLESGSSAEPALARRPPGQ